MPTIRHIKQLKPGVYEFWYDDNTKKVERVDPYVAEIIERLKNGRKTPH